MKEIIRCERCNEILKPDLIVWLELSITDNNYYTENTFPKNHESQGYFPFGKTCAKKEMNKTVENVKTNLMSNTPELLQKPENNCLSDNELDQIITELNEYAQDIDNYCYGLPMYEPHRQYMINIIKNIINKS
jgi:hypothetical protein